MTPSRRLSSSFRDPSGSLFEEGGSLYRTVQKSYQDHYNHLIQSGLYSKLVELGLLVEHEESDASSCDDENAYKILKPALVPFVSYPYEWS